jgi:signal transduction histidine kinase
MTGIELIKLILKKEQTVYSDRVDMHLQRCMEEIERMTQIMDNILLLGKIQMGKMPFTPQKQDITSFLLKGIQNFEMIFPNRKVVVTFYETAMYLNFDSKLLDHILINLLMNAHKYSNETEEIIVSVKDSPKFFEFTIKDYGIGIPEEEQEHLFTSFFRASNTIKFPGTGLGLGIVKQFVELHNGTVSVASKVNRGCAVTIKLPK